MAKLDENDIRKIRKSLANGERNVSIARNFGVTAGCISKIRNGNTWKEAE